MIPIIYPSSFDVFERAEVIELAADLAACGVPSRAIASREACGRDFEAVPVTLVLDVEACLALATVAGDATALLRSLEGCPCRVDLVLGRTARPRSEIGHVGTDWFAARFHLALQVGPVRVVTAEQLRTVVIPATLSLRERLSRRSATTERPLPWAMIGSSTPSSAALVEAMLHASSPHGFIYMPRARGSGGEPMLTLETIRLVLARTELFVWGAEQAEPHADLHRARLALVSGAIPVMITPKAKTTQAWPWAFHSLKDLQREVENEGLETLYARSWNAVLGEDTIGAHVKTAITLAAPGILT